MPASNRIYENIISAKQQGKKQLAVLVDPDKSEGKPLELLCANALENKVDYFFAGGSLLTNGSIKKCISTIKSCCNIPVIIFPGSELQIDEQADAILFLSLISGRNADLLIGKHVIAAPLIQEKKIEYIPTGYILIESGNVTTVQYISNTKPIPSDKNEIAASTALAGEMLGMKLIFLEAGSGAQNPVPETMIDKVSRTVTVPLIVGGGIRSGEKAWQNYNAGADLIVVGNSLETDPSLLNEIASTRFEIFASTKR